jgi:hypothetical protein
MTLSMLAETLLIVRESLIFYKVQSDVYERIHLT